MRGFTDEERAAWIKSARLIDDMFMRACLDEAPECVGVIVEAALGEGVVSVELFEPQADLKSLTGRSLELDFLVEDAQGRAYDIEIESGSSSFPPRRARYHAALLDARSLAPGQDFSQLPDSIVLVVSEEDQVGTGELLTVVSRAISGGAAFDDGASIMYVNCQAADDTPLGRVAHDFLCADPDDMKVPQLAERVRRYKELGYRRDEMHERQKSTNKWEQLLIDRNYDEGLEKGLEKRSGGRRRRHRGAHAGDGAIPVRHRRRSLGGQPDRLAPDAGTAGPAWGAAPTGRVPGRFAKPSRLPSGGPAFGRQSSRFASCRIPDAAFGRLRCECIRQGGFSN